MGELILETQDIQEIYAAVISRDATANSLARLGKTLTSPQATMSNGMTASLRQNEDREAHPFLKPDDIPSSSFEKARGAEGQQNTLASSHSSTSTLAKQLVLVLLALAVVVVTFENRQQLGITKGAVSKTRSSSFDDFLESYRLPSWYYDHDAVNLTANPKRRPTVEMPFIVFHQRKTGGSTIRDELHQAALNFTDKTQTFIPCHGVPCETYHTPINESHGKESFVYGGHLYYSTFQRTLLLRHGHAAKSRKSQVHPTAPNFTCFTVYRAPVSRIVSCWNYRMVQEEVNHQKAKRIADLNPKELPTLLTFARSKFGTGCLNEPMRIFSSVGWDESVVNHLDPIPEVEDILDGRGGTSSGQRAVQQAIVDETIVRSSGCVVGILERPDDTQKVVQRYLPWFSEFLTFNEHLNTGRVQKGNLTNATIEAIQSVSQQEQKVYDMANRILDKQLAMAEEGLL